MTRKNEATQQPDRFQGVRPICPQRVQWIFRRLGTFRMDEDPILVVRAVGSSLNTTRWDDLACLLLLQGQFDFQDIFFIFTPVFDGFFQAAYEKNAQPAFDSFDGLFGGVRPGYRKGVEGIAVILDPYGDVGGFDVDFKIDCMGLIAVGITVIDDIDQDFLEDQIDRVLPP